MKPLLTQDERNYILAGNYKLLDMVIASAEGKIQEANRKVLLIERKYDEMLERKNALIDELTMNINIL